MNTHVPAMLHDAALLRISISANITVGLGKLKLLLAHVIAARRLRPTTIAVAVNPCCRAYNFRYERF